ncbi:MAG: hypothetical protein KIT22_15285, partial [Verrucomicrobiae bacterium]|nr:hypothetical protein [Verrucomicrobiae bacterium]
LIPSEKRASFSGEDRKRHHKTVTSVEFAGRWTLLRDAAADADAEARPEAAKPPGGREREESLEAVARALLRRYGVVGRRLLEREVFQATWFELSRVYHRLEARGEIRGGHFVSGMSGEQFALPEAIGLLRSIRNAEPTGELMVLNAADPLNLVGILTPGLRVPAISANRILLRDGVALAALEGGKIVQLQRDAQGAPDLDEGIIEKALTVGSLASVLRPYYS